MNKTVSRAFGKKVYLLGQDAEGTWYWLVEASFDCGWYWGLGYIATYTNNKNPNNAKDSNLHTHFDSMFSRFEEFEKFFVESPLGKNEKYVLYELMKSAYIAKHYAEMLHIHGAFISKNPASDVLRNDDEYERINKVVIPEIMKNVYELLSP